MAWTSAGSISLKSDWQYTEPLEGAFFRLKHTSFPAKGQFQIAQAEFNSDNSVNLSEPLTIDVGAEYDTLTLLPPSHFSNRRLAIRKLNPEPTIESQIRKVLRSTLLNAVEENFFLPRRSAWSVAIEVSDVPLPVQETTDYSPQFNSLDQQLTTVRSEIAALSTQLTAVGKEVSQINAKVSNPGSTTPTSTATDPNFSNVVLLLHMDGANNSVVFTDVKGKAITVSGDTKILTTESKFGGASAYFDGSGDYLSIPISADFQFGSGDFTWECWVRPANITPSAPMSILGNALGGSAGNGGIFLGIQNSKFILRHWVNGSSNATSSQTIVANTWYHVAAIKSGTALKIFVDGVQGLDGSTTLANQDNQFQIGTTLGNAGFATNYSGYLDEVRITKGIVRYTSNFTVPTATFSNN